jgi:chromosome partitioning protein
MITLLGSEKGGVGKSTIAANFLAILAAKGHSVVGVDSDIQGALSIFNEVRHDEKVEPEITVVQHRVVSGGRQAGKALYQTYKDLSTRYEHLVIDTAGHDSVELRVALSICDILVSPCHPAFYDLAAIDRLVTNVDEATLRRDKPMRACLFLNRVHNKLRVKTHLDAVEELEKIDGFERLDTMIHDRIAFVYSLAQGRSVTEMTGSERDNKAIEEMNQLVGEIYG